MTAEDILAKHHCTQTEFEHKSIIAAMQEFAEQEAVEFAEWVRNNTIADGAPKLCYIKDKTRKTISELYNEFKQRNG